MNKDTTKLDFDQILLQVYRQPVTNTKPEKRQVSLRIIFTQFAEPSRRTIEIFDLIEQAERTGDQKEKARLKKTHLVYLTPCVEVYRKRDYASIVRFTGILVLDWDHIDNAAALKQYLFEKYKCIIGCWLSPSRRGVKALVKIPIVKTIEEFKEYYFGIAEEMQQYAGFDNTGQNCVLPLFQSWDPDLLERSDPETWIIKAKPAPPRPPISMVNINSHPSDKQRTKAAEIIFKGFITRFRHITDVGHPFVRSIAYTAGGYIAAGYLDEIDVLRFMDNWIDSHGYLKQKTAGYKRTVRDMINRGKAKPLKLITTSSNTQPNTPLLNDFLNVL